MYNDNTVLKHVPANVDHEYQHLTHLAREFEHKHFQVLVVDDDPDDQFLATRALGKSRFIHGVNCIRDGKDLIDYLRGQGKYNRLKFHPRPNVILLDIQMPQKDGIETLQELKSDPALSTIPIVMVTGCSADHKILEAFDLGANAYITKPINPYELLMALRKGWNYSPVF